MGISRRQVMLAGTCSIAATTLSGRFGAAAFAAPATAEQAWLQECSRRFQQRALLPTAQADEMAQICLVSARQFEDVGADMIPDYSGTEAADSELSYWTD